MKRRTFFGTLAAAASTLVLPKAKAASGAPAAFTLVDIGWSRAADDSQRLVTIVTAPFEALDDDARIRLQAMAELERTKDQNALQPVGPVNVRTYLYPRPGKSPLLSIHASQTCRQK